MVPLGTPAVAILCNQFYMALVTINLIGRFPPSQYPIGKFFSENLSFPYHDMLNQV
jgi:hypothetical protein